MKYTAEVAVFGRVCEYVWKIRGNVCVFIQNTAYLSVCVRT